MTTLCVQAPGSDEDQALSHSLLFTPSSPSQFVDRCDRLTIPSRQEPDTTPSWIRGRAHSGKCVASPGATKRRMSLLRKKASQKPATILHAVPETPDSKTALHPDQRDVTTQAPTVSNGDSTLASGSQSTPPQQETTPYCPVTEVKSAFSTTSLKGAIGTYKHGRIQWRHKDRDSNEIDNTSTIDRTSKPKIQVVIPRGSRDRPLPLLPFFATPTNTHEHAHDVSPPSASVRGIMRDSIVSPIGNLQPQPIPFGQFQRSFNHISNANSPLIKHSKNIPDSGNSSSDSQEDDTSSTYSNHSSETSLETDTPSVQARSLKYSPKQPCTRPLNASGATDPAGDSTRHGIAPSLVPPRRYAHNMPGSPDSKFQPTCELDPVRWVSTNMLTRKPTLTRKSSKRNQRRSLASSSSLGTINEAITRSTTRQLTDSRRVASPTLSEAEDDLHKQLTSFSQDKSLAVLVDDAEQALTSTTEDSPFKWDDVVARSEAANHKTPQDVKNESQTALDTVEMPSVPPPAVPRKSSKRKSVLTSDKYRLSQVPNHHIVSQLTRGRSRRRSKTLTIAIPEYKRVTQDFVLTPIETSPKAARRTITPGSAETVILNILSSLDHLEDLFATAVLNGGFYRVFKRHELPLIKSTLRKMSPAAWEFREIAFPGHDMLHAEDLEMTRPEEEYTPSTYLQLQKRDIHIIRAIKSQILEKCQSFVRPEISIALSSENPIESARVDNALWRIWTFCKIFGSGKGREEDIVAQMDWLKGGLLVHQKTCTFSIMSTDYMSDTLVGAPECFAKGNEGGLTAEQLFDIMELWNCLGVLLQGFEGRTIQAREAGIYDNTDIRGGDIDGEEMMLDEWCYHLLTFGPATVLDLAGPCRQPDSSPFRLAMEKGWVNWKPPVFGGTRRNFLKEAASRVYEDKIANTYAAVSTRDMQRQQSKIRIQKHITELRHRKNNGERMPMIRMSQERPMSEWDTVIGNLTRPRPVPAAKNDLVSHVPAIRSALAQELSVSISELPAARTPPPPSARSSSPRRTVAEPLLPTPPPSTVPSTRDRNSIAMSMPSIEEHPAYRRDEFIPEVPSLSGHPAFRNGAMVCAPLPSNYHARQNSNTSLHSQGSNGSAAPAFQQHPAQRDIYSSESYENTADKAIYRIVEMGFTADQAREALRMTDLGDGLRVDRAVELLLNRRF